MSSIIIKYMNEQDAANSPMIGKLRDKGMKYPTEVSISTIRKKLSDLLGWNVSDDWLILVIKPWLNTLQLISIVEGVSISEERRQFLDDILNSIDRLKFAINSSSNNGLTLNIHALVSGCEPDFNLFVHQLSEIKKFVQDCVDDMGFRKGGKYSVDKIESYGVYSLFKIGEEIGIKHSCKPSFLFAFVRGITGLTSKKVSKLYSEYKASPMFTEIQNNRLLEYIYSPTIMNVEIYGLYNKMFPYRQKCLYQKYVYPLTLPIFSSVKGR